VDWEVGESLWSREINNSLTFLYSGSAIVAGALIANHFFHPPLPLMELLELCISIESHPDNVTPSLLGGCVACCRPFPPSPHIIHHLSFNEKLRLIIAIPNMNLSTSESRKVIPSKYDKSDVVRNLI
jgi:homoserine kinase